MLAGCSETGFQNMFGAGKYTPDESQVAQNQSLSVPPDLALRPPSNEPAPHQQPVYMPPPQPVSNQPYNYDEPVDDTQQAYNPPAQQAYTPPAQQAYNPQQPAPEPQDVYARLGISKTRPDGSPKTQAELNEELRQKKIAAQKAANPNYGSIWNMGNVWSDSQ